MFPWSFKTHRCRGCNGGNNSMVKALLIRNLEFKLYPLSPECIRQKEIIWKRIYINKELYTPKKHQQRTWNRLLSYLSDSPDMSLKDMYVYAIWSRPSHSGSSVNHQQIYRGGSPFYDVYILCMCLEYIRTKYIIYNE